MEFIGGEPCGYPSKGQGESYQDGPYRCTADQVVNSRMVVWKVFHVPDMEREQLRSLFRRRNDLVKDYRRIKSLYKITVVVFRRSMCPRSSTMAIGAMGSDHWLDDMEFEYPQPGRPWTVACVCSVSWTRNFGMFRHSSGGFARPIIRRIISCSAVYPGIGGIVACGILCELGDLRRFSSVKHLSGYVGLAPGMYQSGDNYRITGMTPRAHRLIRCYFVEAAWQAIRADPVMQAYYRKHLGKNIKKIIIKVARKLLSRTLAVIKTETPYVIGVIE